MPHLQNCNNFFPLKNINTKIHKFPISWGHPGNVLQCLSFWKELISPFVHWRSNGKSSRMKIWSHHRNILPRHQDRPNEHQKWIMGGCMNTWNFFQSIMWLRQRSNVHSAPVRRRSLMAELAWLSRWTQRGNVGKCCLENLAESHLQWSWQDFWIIWNPHPKLMPLVSFPNIFTKAGVWFRDEHVKWGFWGKGTEAFKKHPFMHFSYAPILRKIYGEGRGLQNKQLKFI